MPAYLNSEVEGLKMKEVRMVTSDVLPRRGFVLPKLTEKERLDIKEPMEGEMINQTDGERGIYAYTPEGWSKLIHVNNTGDILKEPPFIIWSHTQSSVHDLHRIQIQVDEINKRLNTPWYKRIFGLK